MTDKEKLQYASAIIYKETEQSKTDCKYFIQQYTKIEDRDSAELAVPFELWDGQKKALQAFISERLNIVLKARQLGLTWLTLAYAIWCMLFSSGYSVVALSKKEDDAKELVRRVAFILRHLPSWMIKEDTKENKASTGLKWTSTTMSVTILHKESSVFNSFSAAPDSGRSFTANLVILDEWAFQQWAREIWTAAYPTINRPTGGKLIGLSTIERGSLFEEVWLKSIDGDNTFNRIFLGWQTDPRRTEKWYEQTKKDLGDATLAEYPATEEEAFMIPGGAFFPEVRAYIHIKPVRTFPSWYKRYVSLDYGLDATAAIWYIIDDSGRAIAYREFYKSDLIISEAAKAILKAGQGERISEYLAPPDLWNRRQDTGKSAAEIFGENKVWLTKTSNDREQGWMNVKEWLKPYEIRNEQTGELETMANLTIQEGTAPNLWRCILNIQKDKKNPNDVATQPHELTHLPDSLRCFCVGRTCSSVEPSKPTEGKLIDKLVKIPKIKSLTGR